MSMSLNTASFRSGESRVGMDAMDALRRGARVRALVTIVMFIGTPVLFLAVAAIPPIRIYVLFFAMGWFVAGIVALILSLRYAIRQQQEASRLASAHLGIAPGGPLIPARVIRYGSDFIDAWLVGHGLPIPGSGTTAPGAEQLTASRATTPFQDRKTPTNIALGIMFAGAALLIPWGILLIRASIIGSGPSPILLLLMVAAFALIALGLGLVIVFSRQRVRARIAWHQSHQRPNPN